MRVCLRKGCGRKYQPRRWNQHYCQDPECLRLVMRWQAARRQAKRRQDDAAKAQHAETQDDEHKQQQQNARDLVQRLGLALHAHAAPVSMGARAIGQPVDVEFSP